MASESLPDALQSRLHGAPARSARSAGRTIALTLASTCVAVLGITGASYAVGFTPLADPVDRFIRDVSDHPRTDPEGLELSPGHVDAGGIDPLLMERFEDAQDVAADAGHELTLTSGYRSWAEQQALYDAAVARHGSEKRARRLVLPPEESAHVRGLAIDVGPRDAARWLERNGAYFGLCRMYVNEWWHFEPVIEPEGECPPMRRNAAG